MPTKIVQSKLKAAQIDKALQLCSTHCAEHGLTPVAEIITKLAGKIEVGQPGFNARERILNSLLILKEMHMLDTHVQIPTQTGRIRLNTQTADTIHIATMKPFGKIARKLPARFRLLVFWLYLHRSRALLPVKVLASAATVVGIWELLKLAPSWRAFF